MEVVAVQVASTSGALPARHVSWTAVTFAGAASVADVTVSGPPVAECVKIASADCAQASVTTTAPNSPASANARRSGRWASCGLRVRSGRPTRGLLRRSGRLSLPPRPQISASRSSARMRGATMTATRWSVLQRMELTT